MTEALLLNGYEIAAIIFTLLGGFALIAWACRTRLSFEHWDKLSPEERQQVLKAVLDD